MAEIPNQCPNCGAELSYNPEVSALTCSHCETIKEISNQEKFENIKPFDETTELEEVKSYMTQFYCESCGRTHSVLSTDKNENCPFCGAGGIKQKFVIRFQPDSVLPAKISEKKINQDFKLWIKKRKFAPNAFKKQSKLNKLHLAYYPAWSYFADFEMSYSGIGVIYDEDSEGNRTRSTRHFSGTTNDSYSNYFQYASTNSSNLRQLGFFNLSESVPYKEEYFYGCNVKTTDYNLQEGWALTRDEIINQQIRNVQSQYHFDEITAFNHTDSFSNTRYFLTYLPIYELNYSYKDKLYTCYANGVSGYISGKFPKSPVKITFFTIGILAIIALIVFLIGKFVQ